MTVDIHCFTTDDGKLVAVRIGNKIIRRHKAEDPDAAWQDFCIRVVEELFVQSPRLITHDKDYTE